jgi:ABC-type phosphate transport system substrate-binding protein
MTKCNLLSGASALVAVSLALAGAAHADTTTATSQVYGEGSTLIGPYLRVVGNCFGQKADLVVQGTAASSPPLYPAGSESFISLDSFDFPGVGANHTKAQDCSTTQVNTAYQINFLNAGSGNGELGAFTHDVATDMGVTTDGNDNHQQYPGIQYGAGDYAVAYENVVNTNGTITLTNGDAYRYKNGGTLSQTTGNSASVTLLAPGDMTAPSGFTYTNPTTLYGNFIQVPISIDAVAIAYSPVYAVANNAQTGQNVQYSFNVKTVNKDGSGGLRLSMPVLCAIMNGAITNWNDPAIKYLNGNQSLESLSDPTPAASFSVPIQLVGRADSSGTTSIFYRALAAQCPATGPLTVKTGATTTETLTGYTNNYGPNGGKKLPSALVASNTLGKFNTYTGSTAVAAAIGTLPSPGAGQYATHGQLGYIGTDYVLPEANNAVGGVNNYNLNVVDISKNAPNYTTFIEPTATSALAAFGSGATAILPPQSTAAGAYTTTAIAANSHGLRSQPADWAEPITTTYVYSCGSSTTGACATPDANGQSAPVPTPLANPAAATAYPLVGTTNAFLNTCYAQGTNGTTGGANVASNQAVLKAFFQYYYGFNTLYPDTVNYAATGLLAKAGFGALPTAWRTAIYDTFFAPTTTTKTVVGTDSLNLAIEPVGFGGNANGTEAQCKTVSPGA